MINKLCHQLNRILVNLVLIERTIFITYEMAFVYSIRSFLSCLKLLSYWLILIHRLSIGCGCFFELLSLIATPLPSFTSIQIVN